MTKQEVRAWIEETGLVAAFRERLEMRERLGQHMQNPVGDLHRAAGRVRDLGGHRDAGPQQRQDHYQAAEHVAGLVRYGICAAI